MRGPAAPSQYLRTKGEGEANVHRQGMSDDKLAVASFRPSVIYGSGDAFFNRFATLLAVSPGVLPLACAQSRLAPVHVSDVVRAFVHHLLDELPHGERYDLCGPREYTLGELVAYTAETVGVNRWVLGLSDGLSRLQAPAARTSAHPSLHLRQLPLAPGRQRAYRRRRICTPRPFADHPGISGPDLPGCPEPPGTQP